MNAASERVGVGNPMYCAPVDPYDITLLRWRDTLRERCPHFSQNANGEQPGVWFGLYVRTKDEADARLRAVIGFTYCINQVVLIDAIMCEPSKVGRASLAVLMATLREQWRSSWTVRFFCERDNRKMRRMVEALDARPVALMYEIPMETH